MCWHLNLLLEGNMKKLIFTFFLLLSACGHKSSNGEISKLIGTWSFLNSTLYMDHSGTPTLRIDSSGIFTIEQDYPACSESGRWIENNPGSNTGNVFLNVLSDSCGYGVGGASYTYTIANGTLVLALNQ